MRRLSSLLRPSEVDNRRRIVTLVITLILFAFAIVFIIHQTPEFVTTWHEPTRELDSSHYFLFKFRDGKEAAAFANEQITEMEVGNVTSILIDDEYFTSVLVQDFEMGNIVYWSVGSDTVDASILARTGEIVDYFCFSDPQNGSLSKEQIIARAESIASQFHPLPDDRSEPYAEFETFITYSGLDVDTNTTHTIEEKYWFVRFIRLKDGIETTDTIYLMLDAAGNLHSYYKEWNMELDSFDTTYTVTKEEAEATALEATGPGSIVNESYQLILRPTNMGQGEEWVFGLDPICAWVVWVEDAEHNAHIYEIDGNENEIVGWDYGHGWYQ